LEPPSRNDEPTAILLGCVKAKAGRPLAARDLYVSPLFRKRRAYAEASGRPWFIYSAKHGIVDPDFVLEPYDQTLNAMPARERRALGELAARQLADRFGDLRGRVFEIHAGDRYVQALAPPLAERRARLVNPVEGLRLGEQLHWYGDRRA
jgi:hypothetical protein